MAIFQLWGKLWWLKSGLFSLKVGGILIFQSGNTVCPGDFQTPDKFAKERDVVNTTTGMADFEPISDTEKVLNRISSE